MSLRDMFSRSKKKRTLTPTGDPSESSHSFVDNVKSQVSRLVPAKISQWFSSTPPNSTGNGSILSGDCTDSSEDEPDPLPPAKRKRYNTQETQYNQCFQTEPTPFHSDSSEIANKHNVLYTSIQSAPGRNTFTREAANYATSSRFVTNAEESSTEPSTSQTTPKDVSYKSLQIPSTSGQSVATKRKSIFERVEKHEDVKAEKHSAQASTSLSEVKPRFRPSLYGSPFYPGPTMYGGSSASTYINRPIINHQKVIKVTDSPKEDSSSLSSSTRKILDLLENCSSPLVEAKRIPVMPNRKHSLNRGTPISHGPRKSDSYKMQELHVPGIASILRVKQRSRLMETTKAARQILASHSSTQPGFSLTPKGTQSDSSRTTEKEDSLKMKTRLTRANRGDDSLTMPEPVQLPTAVLHIDKDNLPKFSITSPSSMSVNSSSFTKKQISSEMNNTMLTNISASTPNRCMFKFASPAVSPVAMSQDLQVVNNITSATDNQNVDEPKAREETLQPNAFFKKAETPVITPIIGRHGSTGWKCSDCWVNNKADTEKCVACGGKRPSTGDKGQGQLTPAPVLTALDARGVEDDWKCDNCWIKNKCSVKKCAACGGSKTGVKENTSSVAAPLMLNCKTPAEEWSCKNCWIKNKISVETCAACGDPKPRDKDGTSTSTPYATQPEEGWKCDNCWIKNQSSVKKCAACGGTKPGAGLKKHTKPDSVPESHSPFYKPPDHKLQEIIRAQKNKWECSGCLTRNDPDKTKCQCCEMEREGPSKELTSKPFTFPKESNINFKFGIDPKEQEKNLAKKAEEEAKVGLTLLEKKETNNNNTYIKIPMTTFSENKCKDQKPTENKNDDKADSVVPEGPTESFTFGIQKSGESKLSAPAVVPSVDKPIENLKPTQGNFTFGTGFLATSKSEQGTQPKTFPSFVNTSTDKSQRSTTEPNTASPNTNIANNDKDNSVAFRFSNVSGGKPKQVTFGGVTGESASSPASSPFSFGTSQVAPASTVATPLAPLFSSPIAAAASTHSATLFTSTPAAATTAAPSTSLFSSQQAPVIPTTQFSSPQTVVTTAAQSTSLFSSAQPTTAASEPSAGSIFGAAQPDITPASTSSAAPLFSLKNDGSNATVVPFSFGSANNDNKSSPFGSTNNNDSKTSPFGSANNNDNRTSPFGARFTSGGTSSTFTMGTAAVQPGGGLGSGSGSVGTSMSRVNEPGTSASSAVFSTQESTWGGKGDTTFGQGSTGVARNATPFAFGAVGNQFQASGTAAGGTTTLFGAQPAAGAQGVFGMSNTSGSGGGLFGTTMQPAQPSTIFGAQPAPSLFGAQNQTTPFGAAAPTQPSTFGAPASTQAPAFGATQSQPSVFGAPTQNQPPAFGAPAQNQPSTFGAPAQNQSSAFGAPTQSQPPTFGVPAQSQPPAFGAPSQSQPPAFGAPSQSQPPAFGVPSQSQPPAFGAPTQNQPSAFGAPASNQPSAFGAPAQPAPAPAPAFNFGTPIFSFGQQAQQQSQPPPVYSFGGMSGGLMSQPMDGGLGAQFNVGSAPAAPGTTGPRRIRKAMRRNQPR